MKKTLATLITASSLLFSQNAFPIIKNLEINLYNSKPQTSQNEKKSKRSQTNYISLETAKYFIEYFGRDNSSLRVNGNFFDTYSKKANVEAIIYQNGNLHLNLQNNSKKTPSLYLDNIFGEDTENKYVIEITAEDLNDDKIEDITIDALDLNENSPFKIMKIIYFSQGNGKFIKTNIKVSTN